VDESPSEVLLRQKMVMSLESALKAGPLVNDRPVASPQHRRQRNFGVQLEPQKILLPGGVGTPPGLAPTADAAATAMSMSFTPYEAVNPLGLGWPSAAQGLGITTGWTPPSCLLNVGDASCWNGPEPLNPETHRGSLFSSTSDLEKSIQQLIRSRTEVMQGPTSIEEGALQMCS